MATFFNTWGDREEKASAILIRITNDSFKIELPTRKKGWESIFIDSAIFLKTF